MSEEKTMKNTEQKIPALRFPEFSGEWEDVKFGSLYNFERNNSYSRVMLNYEKGITKNIHYGDIHTKFKTHFDICKEIVPYINLDIDISKFSEDSYCKEGDLVIADASEDYADIGKAIEIINLNNEKVLAGLHTILARPKQNKIAIGFGGALMLSPNVKAQIKIEAQGIKVLGLSASRLSTLEVFLPSLPEQQKIADFLSAVDTRLQLLKDKKTKIEEYKRGVMQRIFSQELRFTRPDGSAYPDWEEKKLGEIGTTYNGLSGKTAEDFGLGKPYIQYKQIFDNSKIDINKCGFVNIVNGEKQNEVVYGDILFTTSSETPHEVGSSSVILDEVKNTYLNSFCFGFRPNSLTELYPSFSRYLFRSETVRKDIITLAQGSTRYNMSKIEFLKIGTFIPHLDEQRQIADFLSAIDDKISLLSNQIQSTEQYKKGLLQQMFV